MLCTTLFSLATGYLWGHQHLPFFSSFRSPIETLSNDKRIMRKALQANPLLLVPQQKTIDYILNRKGTFNIMLYSIDLMAKLSPQVRCSLFQSSLVLKSDMGFPVRKDNPGLAALLSKATAVMRDQGLIEAQNRATKLRPCNALRKEFVPIPIHPLLGTIIVLLLGCTIGGIALVAELVGRKLRNHFKEMISVVMCVWQDLVM